MSRFSGGWGRGGGGAAIAPAAAAQSKPAANPAGASRGPYPTYRFLVEISGITVAQFSECGGLEVKVKTELIRQGGQNAFTHVLPGRIEYGNLTLKRGYVSNSELYTWCMSVLNRQGNPVQRKDVTVSLVAPSGNGMQTIFQWTFLGAYPVKWTGPAFKASDNGVSLESLDLAHEGLR